MIHKSTAFSLLELIIVTGILSILLFVFLPAIIRAHKSSQKSSCMNRLKQINFATLLYAQENNDFFPRSQHSAFVFQQLIWGKAISQYLSTEKPETISSSSFKALFNSVYRCPSDLRWDQWSYGINVYFELGSGDDYTGSPMTWRRTCNVPSPIRTVLFAENTASVDHIMPHFWEPNGKTEVDHNRHSKEANYNFVDGHSESLELKETIDFNRKLDRWNPGLN